MTHVNLNAQPEAIRQFVLTCAVPPDGTVLEVDGRPVACLIPPPVPTIGAADDGKEWTEAKNRRWCELIDREYDHGLTPTEEIELVSLQSALRRYVDKVAPLPIEAARKLHQQLLEKAAQARPGIVFVGRGRCGSDHGSWP